MTAANKLTARQLQVAVYVHTYLELNDNLPTKTEIASAFGVTDNASFEHIKALTKKGVFEPAENPNKLRFARTPTGAWFRQQITAERARQGASTT